MKPESKYRLALIIVLAVNAPVLALVIYAFDISWMSLLFWLGLSVALDLVLISLFGTQKKRP
jgi:hypothetical protein